MRHTQLFLGVSSSDNMFRTIYGKRPHLHDPVERQQLLNLRACAKAIHRRSIRPAKKDWVFPICAN
jgi:hypothetical protein